LKAEILSDGIHWSNYATGDYSVALSMGMMLIDSFIAFILTW